MQRNGDGSYTAVVNGQAVGGSGLSQSQAEQAFNANSSSAQQADQAAAAGGGGSALPANGGALPAAGGDNVSFNTGYEDIKLRTLQANIQAAYNNALVKGANQDRALQAAYEAAQLGGNLIKTYGDQALQALQQATTAGLGVADMMARLQGPSNAFAYDRAMSGVGQNGLGNSINALTGNQRPVGFGMSGPTSAMTLQSMGAQAAASGQAAGFGGAAASGQQGDLNSMVKGLGGQHLSITDQLMGISGNAIDNLAKVNSGQLPFSLPKFDAGGSGNVA